MFQIAGRYCFLSTQQEEQNCVQFYCRKPVAIKYLIDSFTYIPADKWLRIIAAILGSLLMGQTWSREQGSGQMLMTLLGIFWRRSSWVVFPICPVNALQWSRSLFSIINTGMGLFDIIRVVRPLPADVQHYLEFSPVFHLRFWKLVLSQSLEKPEQKTVCLTPPFMRSAKTHLLTYLRSKETLKFAFVQSRIFCTFLLHERKHFILIEEYSHSLMSVKLLLVLSGGHLPVSTANVKM